MTIVEVMVAMCLLAITMASVFSAFMTARRLTEATVYSNAAVAITQGYIEQIKNMTYSTVAISSASGTSMTGTYSTTATNQIPTQTNEVTSDTLVLSPLPVLDPSTLTTSRTVGTVPSAVYDNVKTFTVNRANDLTLHLWVWVEDKTPSGVTPTQQIKAITIIYMSRFTDGTTPHYSVGSVRNMRSLVPSY